MLINNSHGVLMDFGSMTPAVLTMKNRSEAQRWQVRCERMKFSFYRNVFFTKDWAEENCCVQCKLKKQFSNVSIFFFFP